MDNKELIDNVCYELRSYIAYLEHGEGYEDNDAYRYGLKHAQQIREYILELKKLKKSL